MPGIPLRADAIQDLVDCYFKLPAPINTIIISVVPGEQPLEKRGALLAISPEEVRHAVMAAISRDIKAGVEAEVLRQWRSFILCCSATFKLHSTETARLQAAMQLHKHLAIDHEIMSRASLRRIYEVPFFREAYARAHSRAQDAAANIAEAYAQVRMAKGREKITKSFVDAANGPRPALAHTGR